MAERFELCDYAYAHRGFWAKDGAPENSIEAYRAAASAGLGIELDVRPAADGTPVCFHDPLLDRMTNRSGLVAEHSPSELGACRLPNHEPIPLFSELLKIWPHDLPMLVEMKIDGATDPVSFATAVADLVTTHPGKAAMMSFSEEAVSAIPSEIMCGQLIGPSSMIGEDRFDEKFDRACSGAADYLALHISDATIRSDLPLPAVCWTVTELLEREKLRHLGIAEIFEHLPAPLAA